MSTANVVPFGAYFGFSLSELNTELTRYKTAMQQSYSRLTGSNINGNSYTFGARTDGSLKDWQTELQAAFGYLDPGRFPFDVPTNSAVVVSR